MFSCICIRTILTFLSQYVNKMVTAEYGTSSMGVDMQHLLVTCTRPVDGVYM